MNREHKSVTFLECFPLSTHLLNTIINKMENVIVRPLKTSIFRPWEDNTTPPPQAMCVPQYWSEVRHLEQQRLHALMLNQSMSQSVLINTAYSQQRLHLITQTQKQPVRVNHEATKVSGRSNTSGRYSPYSVHRRRNNHRSLSKGTVDVLEVWYHQNINHPYPSDTQVKQLSTDGQISVVQVKKWMANKRVRSFNTLAFNGSVHPKRLQRIQRQQQLIL